MDKKLKIKCAFKENGSEINELIKKIFEHFVKREIQSAERTKQEKNE